ncbi:hypothetical protein P4C99_09950 [Pontiellaceae bacterium B1224]|nr:hypothetical protein [Pontiellaceae bacterium B1224]
MPLLIAVVLFVIYSIAAPQNHSEAEDVYDFALQVEQGTFKDQTGVNRVLALPMFGSAYRAAQTIGYTGHAFPFMIFINRLLAVVCLLFFYQFIGRLAASPAKGIEADASPDHQTPNLKLQTTLLLAFSYGFWRYANEAETYILASAFVLGAWCLVLRGNVCWGAAVSALGILVHLLNLIPLLLIIPLYYLLSKDWKKALLHGVLTGLLVVIGYAVCSPWLDFSELGAQHHAVEGGVTLSNLLRGGIAFGQNLVSANFLFGFEWFRELLSNLFPSRMLDEEFYMASKMTGWIPWAGVATLSLILVWCLWFGVTLCRRSQARKDDGPELKARNLKPLTICSLVWLVLYALAVIRTEAGSPELWIMALVPFWLLAGVLLPLRANATTMNGCSFGSMSRFSWLLIVLLFSHNLIGGLFPVMSESSDYHTQKSAWLLEHSTADDLVLTSYEPILIFYLNYYCPARLINSSEVSADLIKEELGNNGGNAYAFNSFFQPLESMGVRSPDMYGRMVETGTELFPMFGIVDEDEFGGIYRLQKESKF